jgi:hypothetical protein
MPPALHIQHRRRLAWFACRAMPESFAVKFTPGEHAALKIVGDEMNKHGACSLSPFDIAAAACVSKSTVLLALKKAEAIGLVTAEHRRGTAAVVRSLSTAWPASLLAAERGSAMAKRTAGALTEGEAMVAVTYTSKDIADAIEKIPADDLDLTAIAWCDLHDRIMKETGLSEEGVRQMMKKECLLWVEKMRQFGERILSGKVVPLAIHRQD